MRSPLLKPAFRPSGSPAGNTEMPPPRSLQQTGLHRGRECASDAPPPSARHLTRACACAGEREPFAAEDARCAHRRRMQRPMPPPRTQRPAHAQPQQPRVPLQPDSEHRRRQTADLLADHSHSRADISTMTALPHIRISPTFRRRAAPSYCARRPLAAAHHQPPRQQPPQRARSARKRRLSSPVPRHAECRGTLQGLQRFPLLCARLAPNRQSRRKAAPCASPSEIPSVFTAISRPFCSAFQGFPPLCDCPASARD